MEISWRTATIGTLIDEGVILVHKDGNHGSNYPRTEEFGIEGVPFLTAKLLDDAGNIDLLNAPRLAFEKADKFTFGFIETDDVLLSHNATVGRVAVVPKLVERVLIGTSLTHFRLDNSRLLPRYLAAYFSGREFQNQLAAVMSQTTRNQVPITSQRNLSVIIPPISEQERIADILGSLDDKIELNRQINQILEQIAQTIFKSWFVDFEPVKAKIEAKAAGRDPERAAMCAISGKTEPELDQLSPEQFQQLAATAALFPDELTESEFGLIPEGWEIRSLPDVIEVNPSRTLKKGAITPYLDMANVPTNSARVADVIQREFSSGSKFMNGDTLLARITPCLENGKTAYVDFLAEKQVGWGSTEFIVFRPKAPLTDAFGYLLCRHPDFRAFAIANMSGTSGRQRVPNDCFANYKLAVPSSGVASAFGETVAGIMDGIKARDEEARTLATLRDLLLPRLLNGEMI